MHNFILFDSVACIMFLLKHYIEDGIPCDKLASSYLLTYIGGTHAPIVNILLCYVVKIKICTNYVRNDDWKAIKPESRVKRENYFLVFFFVWRMYVGLQL